MMTDSSSSYFITLFHYNHNFKTLFTAIFNQERQQQFSLDCIETIVKFAKAMSVTNFINRCGNCVTASGYRSLQRAYMYTMPVTASRVWLLQPRHTTTHCIHEYVHTYIHKQICVCVCVLVIYTHIYVNWWSLIPQRHLQPASVINP